MRLPCCKSHLAEALDFIGEHQEYTNRFAEMIVKQVIHNDTHNVAQNNHLTTTKSMAAGATSEPESVSDKDGAICDKKR